jgi:hypothetical protein
MTYLFALALPVIAALLWLLHQERKERTRLLNDARTERQQLLNRIQAPEVAVGQSLEPDGPVERGWVNYDDDDDLAKELARLDGDNDS